MGCTGFYVRMKRVRRSLWYKYKFAKQCSQQKNNSQSNYRKNKLNEVRNTDKSVFSVFFGRYSVFFGICNTDVGIGIGI